MRPALAPLLAGLLLATALPAAAQELVELPRRRPRVTAPSSTTDEVEPVQPRTSTRKNAAPIDGGRDPSPSRTGRTADTGRDRPEPGSLTGSTSFDDDELPPARRRRSAEDEPVRSGSGSDELDTPRRRGAPAPEAAETPRRRGAVTEDFETPRGRNPEALEPSAVRRRSSSEDGRSSDSWADEPADSRRRRTSSRTAEEELGELGVREDERLGLLDLPGHGLGAEVHLGAMLIDDAPGGVDGTFTTGLSFTWQLGRLFRPENELLHKGLYLEGTYLWASRHAGTKEVAVNATYNYLTAAVLAGMPIEDVLVYGKLGPAMYIQPASYEVQGATTSFTGVKGGIVYGVGVRAALYLNDVVGIAARIELARYRRHYMDDTLFVTGIGATF